MAVTNYSVDSRLSTNRHIDIILRRPHQLLVIDLYLIV